MIKLEYFNAADFRQLIEWSGDETLLLQWAGPQFRHPLSEEQLMNYIDGSNDINKSDKLIFKAIDEESGIVVGHISIGGIDRENRTGRIGKVLVGDTLVRGRGIGRQMMEEILKIGFEKLKLHRISLGVFDFNVAGINCYEKVGFTREGLIRDARKFKDEYWNLIEMSILEDEWRSKL